MQFRKRTGSTALRYAASVIPNDNLLEYQIEFTLREAVELPDDANGSVNPTGVGTFTDRLSGRPTNERRHVLRENC